MSGRTALVTGAGRGNGRASALELALNGAAVVVDDLDADPAEETAAAIRDAGGEAVAVPADVSDEEGVAAMVAEGTAALGGCAPLVNTAGVGAAGPFLDSSDGESRERFRANLDVHLWGAINCTQAVVDPMVEQGYGKVVNVTAIHTKNGAGMSAEYDVGKFSLLGLTKSLALELGREGVRVNAVAFLASPAADYVSGRELRVDGGQVPIDSWTYDQR